MPTESEVWKSRAPRRLRAGIIIGSAIALIGITVGTATGAVTPFQQVVVVNTPASPIPIVGTVNVGNTPANQNVTVTNLAANPVQVSVTNLPATQPVEITNIAPAEVADNVYNSGPISETGSRTLSFGKTINVTTLIVAEGDLGSFDVYLRMAGGEGLILVKDTVDHFRQDFTMPVPATGVTLRCTNLVLACSWNVSAFGY